MLSIVVLQFYQFQNFWNNEYLYDYWTIDAEQKNVLIRSSICAGEWKNAFSSQKVEHKGT